MTLTECHKLSCLSYQDFHHLYDCQTVAGRGTPAPLVCASVWCAGTNQKDDAHTKLHL